MISSKNNKFIPTSILVLLLLSFDSYSLGISAFRIYLDNEKADSSFILYNYDTLPQECNLRLRHYNFDASGKMTEYKGKEPLANSAESWVRYSPKRFTLSPANNQTIKFKMRRKANAEPAEYRSYVSVDCGVEVKVDDVDTPTENSLSVSPRLIHNLPIIVRTGKLNASLSISDVEVDNGMVKFKLNRTGDRSVYGDVQLIEKSSGEVISEGRTISIYPETSQYSHSLNMRGKNPTDLRLKFIEDKAFGGDITIEQDL